MKKYRLSFLFRPIAFLLNIATLNISIFSAYFFKFEEIESLFKTPYNLLFLVLNLSWVVSISTTKPEHNSRISFNITSLTINYTKLVLLLTILVSLFWVFFKSYYYSREVLFLIIILTLSLGIIWRIVGVELLKIYRKSGHNYRTYAVLGNGDLSKQIINYYSNTPELGFKNLGVFEEDGFLNHNVEDLLDLVKSNSIDIIYACLPYIENDIIETIIKYSENLPFEVKIISDFRGFFDKGLSIEYHGNLPVLNVSKKPYSDPKVEIIKRVFDLSFSLLVLIIGFPFFVLISLITILTSKGSAFFFQKRTGRWGKEFNIIKFRSMLVNSDKLINSDSSLHSQGKYDPRITHWGRFMRKTRIDELPQFYNVLKGEMSVVGPRPLADYDVAELRKKAPQEFNKLLTLKPGITSIGQLKSGYATNTEEMLERLNYDLKYLESYSFRRDVVLIFKTLSNMVRGSGI